MTAASRHVTLFHSPQSRSAGTLVLLEELGADYELHVLNLKKGEQRGAAYLAVNPMGKVPAIVHDGALVTEQGAVYTYLADLLQAGIKATINSDDPAYFGGYINDNFIATFEALSQLGAADAHRLAWNSFDASFVDAAAKLAMTARLDAVFARYA